MAEVKQSGAIAKKASSSVSKQTKNPTMKDYIRSMQGEIAKALPSVITPERFTRMALSAVSNTPKLAECTPTSFLSAMMNAAQLGLEPNTPLGQAYLIPFKNNKKGVFECQFQIGYKGLIDLAHRTKEYRIIDAQIVYENDEFEYELGLDPVLKHKPARSNRGKPIYYYAIYKLINGGEGFQVMSIEDITNHARKYSKSFNNGPWKSEFDEMAKKTVLKKMLKYAPMKSDFARAVASDESIKHSIDDDMSNVPNEFYDAEYEEEYEEQQDEQGTSQQNYQVDPVTGEVINEQQ